MNSLDLPDETSLIVHRGLSSPICPNAETSQIIANQTRAGYRRVTAAVFIPVLNQDLSGLRFLDYLDLSFKTHGEPNAIINDKTSVFSGWWCHISQIDQLHFGVIGRPNYRYRLGPKYVIPFPHIVSTTKWRKASNELATTSTPYIQALRAIKHPHLAAAFDTTRSRLDP